jgi:hypothetical protein
MAIAIGMHPGWDYLHRDGTTAKGRFYNYAQKIGKVPFYYNDWISDWEPLLSFGNYDGDNIEEIVASFGSPPDNPRLYLHLSVEPNEDKGESMLDVLQGADSWSGFTADEHLVAYSRLLSAYYERFGQPVPVRFMHEFNGIQHPWCSFNEDGSPREFTTEHFKTLWRRMTTILRGGDVSKKLIRLGMRPVQGNPILPYNALGLRIVWCAAVNKHTWIPGNDFLDYWPGPAFVDWVGCDVYGGESNNPVTLQRKLDYLSRMYAFSLEKNKRVTIPEWGRNDGTPDDESSVNQMKSVLEWIVAHQGNLRAACAFEMNVGYSDWRLNDGLHPNLLSRWHSYAIRPEFKGLE